MSPEQIRGESVDPRSDVYSLGVTAYHMLAGEPPYTGDTPMSVAVRHLAGNPMPLAELRPDVSPELCRLVERMMAVRPEDRVPSAAEVFKELNRLRIGGSPARELQDLLTAPAPTTPIVKPPAKASISQSFSNKMLKVRDAVGDERKLHWLAPLSLTMAVLVGAVAAWMLRERDPLPAAVAGSASHHQRLKKDLEIDRSDPEVHFDEANSQPPELREAALWGVLESLQSKDPDEIKATLNAAVELYKLYRDRDGEALTEEVIQWLAAADRVPEQKALAKLFTGFLHVRRGEYEKARKSFSDMEGNKTTEPGEFDRHRLESLADEFYGCLHRMGDQGGEPSSEKLIKDFWRRFTPAVPSRPPKGKG